MGPKVSLKLPRAMMTRLVNTVVLFPNPPTMQIFIKTLTGKKSSFDFEQENLVKNVKEALQMKEGIKIEQIRLIYGGKQMSDESKLSEYNIKAGDTIHMVLQLRGGI